MPRNGSGQYDLPYDWNDDKANGIKVLASRMQNQDQDIANALTGSLAADGQTPLTGDLDFNGNKCVDLADGSDPADSVNVSQVQTGEFQFFGVSTTTPAGTDGEDYDLGPTPSITVYPDYVRFSFVCHFTCIDNPNMRFGSLATKTLKRSNGSGGYIGLKAGDIVANKEYFGILNADINSADIIIENAEDIYPNAANGKFLRRVSGVSSWEYLSAPTITVLSSGSGNYTTPAGTSYLRVQLLGAGGGGAGGNSGGAAPAASNGGNTTFNSITANGGSGAPSINGGAGGTGGAGTAAYRINGNPGRAGYRSGIGSDTQWNGTGANSPLGFGQGGWMIPNSNGTPGTGFGSGGGGGGVNATNCGGGGGSGEYAEFYIQNPSGTYAYSVGAAGAGSASTTSGGPGASGLIIVSAY